MADDGTDRVLTMGDQAEVRDPGSPHHLGGVWHFRPVLAGDDCLGQIVRDPHARFLWWPSARLAGYRGPLRVASWEKAFRRVRDMIGPDPVPDEPVRP